jgi:hypothetical protein
MNTAWRIPELAAVLRHLSANNWRCHMQDQAQANNLYRHWCWTMTLEGVALQ